MNGRQGPPAEVAELLSRARGGDRDAIDRLFPIVYDELRNLAGHHVRQEFSSPTLQATALVHEAYIKLARSSSIEALSRTHFIGIASRAMRQVLVDRARARGAEKRGGGWKSVTLDDGHQPLELDSLDIIALDEAIESLDDRQRQIVEARFFGGLDDGEIAQLLDISDRTVRREWVKARAWLARALIAPGPNPAYE